MPTRDAAHLRQEAARSHMGEVTSACALYDTCTDR
jgi:hypothetical protein